MKQKKIDIIGAGLAGCEAAWQIASRGTEVRLFEMKPTQRSPAHSSDQFAELVCSNSLRSAAVTNAVGLLKEEMRALGSLIIEAADACKVDAGGALAVDREKFSEYVTRKITSHPKIEIVHCEYTRIEEDHVTVIATGPLTSEKLSIALQALIGEEFLHFYDAAAPIVSAESIDTQHSFVADRYDKGDGSYINCPLTQEEYAEFRAALVSAETAHLHDFEKIGVFEGCMPVEVMASRGEETMRFGMLKPVGLTDPKTGKRPYAVLQLRKENTAGTAYNLVGCQTHLTFPEQRRVFGIIPALKNAEFLRFGMMHRNTFVNSPAVMNLGYQLKHRENIFLAGQMTGVEGYVESASSGLIAGINAERFLRGLGNIDFTDQTAIGALEHYVVRQNVDFQPMNANFGIMSQLTEKVRDKKTAKEKIAARALQTVSELARTL